MYDTCDGHDSRKRLDPVAHGELFPLVEHRSMGDYTVLGNKVKSLCVCVCVCVCVEGDKNGSPNPPMEDLYSNNLFNVQLHLLE